MILITSIDNNISGNDELLVQFYPDYSANVNIVIDNSSKPLQKMINKNSNLLALIEKLDLVEM